VFLLFSVDYIQYKAVVPNVGHMAPWGARLVSMEPQESNGKLGRRSDFRIGYRNERIIKRCIKRNSWQKGHYEGPKISGKMSKIT
jgi:hypothetical protein